MRKMSVVIVSLVVSWTCTANVRQVFASTAVFSDDFESGSIDGDLWTVGGRQVSWTPSDQGSWTYSQDPGIRDAGDLDGYLRLQVSGPYTDNSYGAVSWIRTNYNFHDGQQHLLNFCWKPVSADNHENFYSIQITDGYVPTFEQDNWVNSWMSTEPIGTKALLWSQPDGVTWRPYEELSTDVVNPGVNSLLSVKYDWSVLIDPSGKASLFDEPNGTGSLLYQATLDPSTPWYFRAMVMDATSEGFGAGEAQLNLYSFSATVPEPSTLALLGVGAVSLFFYACRRRKRAP